MSVHKRPRVLWRTRLGAHRVTGSPAPSTGCLPHLPTLTVSWAHLHNKWLALGSFAASKFGQPVPTRHSQHVGDDAHTPHVRGERDKLIVDDLRGQELRSPEVHLQLLPRLVPGGWGGGQVVREPRESALGGEAGLGLIPGAGNAQSQAPTQASPSLGWHWWVRVGPSC